MFEFDDLTAWTMQELLNSPAVDYMQFCEIDPAESPPFNLRIRDGGFYAIMAFQCTGVLQISEQWAEIRNSNIGQEVSCMLRKFHRGPCMSCHPTEGPLNVAGPYILP